MAGERDPEAGSGSREGDASATESKKEREADVGEVFMCGGDIYICIVGIVLALLALFNLFGGTASKIFAVIKLIIAIGYAAAIIYGVVKKDAKVIAGVMIATLVLIVFDIIGLVLALFGRATIWERIVSIFFGILRICFMAHVFFVANQVRIAYKELDDEPV
ncbi:hypothetical protein Q1695_013930 [Nippostrongylus brasiliensis]|nr:hypothetical protein Q1695_013930 [Nippostrongylus brasiliensis]